MCSCQFQIDEAELTENNDRGDNDMGKRGDINIATNNAAEPFEEITSPAALGQWGALTRDDDSVQLFRRIHLICQVDNIMCVNLISCTVNSCHHLCFNIAKAINRFLQLIALFLGGQQIWLSSAPRTLQLTMAYLLPYLLHLEQLLVEQKILR